ncbi:MAG: SH3 domain-containing protein [Treponema sp.]
MRKFIPFLLTAAGLFFQSCAKTIGYGVVLWNMPEHRIQDGDVVPVYIKSNISQVYVIGAGDKKIEAPLWQITEPVSKQKARAEAAKYAAFRHTYAKATLDGLPMRAEPLNTAKQVYRLRKNETVRVLFKGEGQAVMSGKTALEGDWLRILTSDGTQGWCFSYNLKQFKTQEDGALPEADEQEEKEDFTDLEAALSKVWRPEIYRQMIGAKRIDPQMLSESYGLSYDDETRHILFKMPDAQGEWDYTGAEKLANGEYRLNDTPLTLTLRSEDSLTARYTGDDGKPANFTLVLIEENIGDLIEQEFERRRLLFEKIYAAGPVFKSSSYGTLAFKQDRAFTWNGYRLLVLSVIAQSAKKSGVVSIKYFTGSALSKNYDGVLTFAFDGMAKEVNFLYRLEANGLRLEDAAPSAIKDGVINERRLSPLVLFFSANR